MINTINTINTNHIKLLYYYYIMVDYYNDLRIHEMNNLRQLMTNYKREDPILLKFSNILFTDEVNDEFIVEIENTFGKAILFWCEPITSEENIMNVMVNLRKSGCRIPAHKKFATHFMYGFFPNWVIKNVKSAELIQKLVYYGEHDFLFSGNMGENIAYVRRVYEKSPEYNERINN